MSHARSWRAACLNTINTPSLHFDSHFYSTRRDSCGRWLWRLVGPLFQLVSDPSRIFPAIQHSPNSDLILNHVVVYSKRESLRQHPVVAVYLSVNSRVKPQRLNIRTQRLEKIRSHACLLAFVEQEAIEKVRLCQAESSNPHDRFAIRRRSRSFASSQLLNFAVPDATARSASSSASLCHAGDSYRFSSRERSVQISSIARSFWTRDIRFRGRRVGMTQR
jgi:hypothetical protein